MSHRLQVLIPPALDARLTKAAQRNRLSKGEWVRKALEEKLDSETGLLDPVAELSRLNAPVSDIEQMLEEIEAGRR